MKYILKKDLPLAKAGTEIFTRQRSPSMWGLGLHENFFEGAEIANIQEKDIPEWLEEVKEVKTIFDLKKGDTYWVIQSDGFIIGYEVPSVDNFFNKNDKFLCFTTEREARRNKLLRELATRTDKWLPEDGKLYTTPHREKTTTWVWRGDNLDVMHYHMGLVFRDEQEYDKWMTSDNKDLLFKL